MKSLFLFVLFMALGSSAFAAAENPEYFLMGKGISSVGTLNSVASPQPATPIYRIYVKNKGQRTAMIGVFRFYAGAKLLAHIDYAISAVPEYGVYVSIDNEQPTLVDRVEFSMTSPAPETSYELYGITVPNRQP